MRPENLKSPFKWDERKVLYRDRVLYVPEYYDKMDEWRFPGWDSPDFFDNDNPIKVEYCSGNGAWIANQAMNDPSSNWVAVEKKFPRVRKIWSKINNFKLGNLIAVCGEGSRVTAHYFPHDSVDEIYINFPDPWPKTRHAKHRIVQPPFVAEMSRILKKGGTITLVTDDIEYSNWMIAVMQGHTGFVSCYEAPFWKNDWPDYGSSYFDDLWREKGRQIRYHRFQKV
jgi:tRNA (guanine-N7-)-methyltransferase